MFKTKRIKNLEKENENLKRQINHMTYEWNKEKTLINKEDFILQKVEMTIGGLDIKQLGGVHRPLCNLTEEEASLVANKCKEILLEKGISTNVSYNWRDSDKVFVINVEPIN